jgi:hypothetical protein
MHLIGKGMFAAAFVTLTALPAAAAPPPADKCEASKNKTAGAYYACREKAEATAILKATAADYSKCDAKFVDKWDKAETTGAGTCPDDVLTASMSAYIAAQAAEAASVISGADIPDCDGDLATCEGDLATCDGDLSTCDDDLATCESDLAACEAVPVGQVHKTGQTTCSNAAGTPIACPGTGQDGQLQRGVANSFTDNGDGTVTDNASGLVWEKLSDDGSIHDKDNTFTWTTAVTTKISTLNTGSFAGFSDWRLPNLNELETLRNLGAASPATFSAFNSACAPACTVTTCSCTLPDAHWSSSTSVGTPSLAWGVDFVDGTAATGGKATSLLVRAVRGGL